MFHYPTGPGVRLFGSVVLLLMTAALMPASVSAMEVEQMRAFAGMAMLDERAASVVQTYGRPEAIEVDGSEVTESDGQAWSAGDWDLVYKPAPLDTPDTPVAVSTGLAAFSTVVLHAKGGVGQVTVRRKPDKTTYAVPADPYLSHQVVSVRAQWRQPVSVQAFIAAYEAPDERFTDSRGRQWLRYWVIRMEGQVPLRLYAVDVRLSAQGDQLTELRANGPEVDFVAEELKTRHRVWERNMYD